MNNFIFDLQRFAEVTILSGDSREFDGVTYTAAKNSQLVLDDDEKVSGIASGKISATVTDAEESPLVIFDASDGAINFSATSDGSVITVTQLFPIEFISGEFTYKGNEIAITAGSDLAIVNARGDYSLRNENHFVYDSTYSFSGSSMTSDSQQVNSTLILTDGDNTRELQLVQLGKVINNFAERGFTLVKGSSEVMNIGGYTLTATAQDADAGMNIELGKDGVTLVPNSGDGALNVVLTRGDKEIISGELECTSGSITFGFDHAVTLAKDTSFNITRNGYTLTATTTAEATTTIELTEDGKISFTPQDGDGGLILSLSKDGKELFGGELNVSGGTISFDSTNQKFSFTEGTTVSITRDERTYDFKVVNDDASFKVEADGKGNFTITPDKGDGSLDISIKRGDKTVFYNNVSVSGSIIINDTAQTITLTKDTAATVTLGKYIFTLKATADATSTIEFTEDGKISITPQDNDGALDISIAREDGTLLFQNTVSVSGGSIIVNPDTLVMTLTKGTNISLALGDYELSATTTADAGVSVGITDAGFVITPQDEDGALDITIKRGDETIFQNTVNVSGGSIIFNPETRMMTLTKDTTVNLSFGDYEVTSTTTADASVAFAISDAGITITPQENDGALNITLTGTSSGSLSANVEVLSGSFIIGQSGAITVTKDTELQIKFSDDYIINFKATADAGGKITLGADGITFAPNDEDGGLELSVTRDGETRSASLDVTGGSVTYKLDGSISLEKGTVVKNVFEDGNILTITANTDTSGTINFNPKTGLTIKPSTPDALNVVLTTGGQEIVNITSIDGTITYSGGVVTASDGTKARTTYYFGWESELRTKGGTASIQFTADRTVYIANEGANFVLDYLDGTTAEIQNGIYSDIYATETTDAIELVSEGSIFNTNDYEQIITLEKAGNYTLNGVDITTSEDNTQVLMTEYNTVTFAADAGITVTASEDRGFRFGLVDSDGNIKVTSTESGDFGVSSGSITFGDKEFFISEGTVISLAKGEQTATLTVTKDISAPIKIEEDIYYLDFDDIIADVAVTQDEQTILTGEVEIDGVFSYRPETGTFGLTGANSSHGDGRNTSLQFTSANGLSVKMETNDTTIVFVPKFDDGKLEFNFPNERKQSMLFTVSRDEQTLFENNVAVNGTVVFDTTNQEISLTKDTVLTLRQGENSIEITALADAGGKFNIVEGGLRFVPNTGDGQLELNFVSANRKANIDVTGALVLGENGKISLEDGTEVTFTWDDGTELKLTSEGSTGSIGIDEKGIKITSEDENLSIDLTTATGDQTHLSGIQGTIYYNAGSVSFDDNSTITATTTLGGEPILITLETVGGTGHLEFASNGVIYSADTGAMQITWKKDDLESTFTVNSGSVQIGHGLFQISEGTDLSTDLKDFVPALYFTTSEAGTYTINGQTIETTAENISMTATDDYMTFKTSEDAITYDGMSFAGAGNVSLSASSGVVLGAGVEATGFGKDKMFVLAEAGNVTADARIFELTEDVPTGISVTGAEDGFIFSRINTEESEARFDDPDPANVGKIFTEEFFLTNDDAYRIQTDLLGLQKIIGVTAPSTLNATATFDGEPERTVFDAVTDNEGVFTIGEKNYSISGDDEVAIKTIFNETLEGVRGFDSLSGTVSGDFTAYPVSINGSASAVQPVDDTLISITADEDGFEVSGLDDGALLSVSAKDSYVVNSTTINANAGDFIAGDGENSAYLLAMNNDTIVNGTEGDDYIGNHGTNVTINALGGNDTLMNYGASNVTINGDADDDFILNVVRVDSETDEVLESPDNVLINGGAGNDYISAEGENVSIDAGDGSNQIKISGENEVILLKGQTTVEGFNTGFGDGSDTIYIKSENDPAGVEFLEDGLTFGNDTASLTLSDVTTTAKVNLFHENRDMLNKGVFIAAGEWYEVEDSDLTVDAGEEVYFVGTAATPKAGVDFSGITGDLNVTMDTAYIDSEEYVPGTPFWVNGVYSLKGGAGNTTITGSKLDDTIISGTGDTTIDGGEGDDLISLSGSSALVKYAEGDGNDTIVGFDADATLSIGDNIYTARVSGDDLIVSVGDSKITLVDAAKLPSPNIESTNGLVQVVEAILKRTALGYPVIAGLVFNPEEITGPEPTNYAAKEDWTITSADNLELYGVHYTPENSNDKWVVLVHGYGCMYESMNPFATFYLANNYNVLMIDQRAAGNSEGTWLTMGVAESQDVALWTQEIANRYPDSKITLHGVSMGAATAILAAARSDVVNVTSIVEDCGYSDVMKTFDTIVSSHPELAVLGISSEIIPLIDPVAESLTGYYLHDAAPIDSIASVKLPTLFISGDDDGVAPVSMLHELYDESGAEDKEKFIVKGAGHARAGLNDPIGYSNAVFRFVAEANGEGWETENIGENISLRGTKYNDTLANSGEGVTIDAGDGDDYIANMADNVSIAGGEGDDTIYNHADEITIDGGAGDDSISNNSENVIFIHSGGDDTIEGFNETSVLQIDGSYSTQKSGDNVIVTVGEDKIVLTDAANLESVQIIDSEGTVIANIDNNTLITGTGGNDSILNIADNVTIKAFGGDDTIDNYGEYAVISGSDGADSITNFSPENMLTANGVSINAGDGNDTIRNQHAYYVTLEGGAGDDHITVVIGNQTKIDGGSGNDTILGEALSEEGSNWAMGGYATINGGDGDDYINPIFSDSASILGGAGNDTIINQGDDATINGGAGDDVISLHGASLNNDVIKYDVGSGNDSIFGFNETSQLSITAGTKYETQISGDDVLVTVGEDVMTIAGGENVLTIAGGASLSTINIVNEEIPALNLTNTTNDTLITGTELADTITNSGSNVTISGKSGNDSIVSSGANGSLNGGAGNDTLSNSGARATVEGYYGDDYLTNSGAGVSVSGNYGNDTIINSGDNATLSPGSGNNSINNSGANVVINYIGGNDTVLGFNETSQLKTAAGASSVRAGGDIIVTVGDDKIILVDAASLVSPNFDDGESVILTEKGERFVDDGRVFELTANVPIGVTLTGTKNGFTSAITDDDGKIFTEEFIVNRDDSYNVSLNGTGVQTVSGISAGADVETSATRDGEDEENQIYVITDGAGSYTFNDMPITASKETTIRLRPQAMAFDADGMTYDGKTFAGTGNVTVSADVVALGASVSVTGFGVGDEFILAQAGTTTVDGRVFELTENISDGMTISVERDGYTFSHEITEKEATKNNVPSDYVGKVYSENVVVEGDDNYSLRADSFGLKKVSGISDGASINGGDTSIDGNSDDKYAAGGQYFYVDTNSEGAFTFGEKVYSISGDSNVELEADFNPIYACVRGVQSLAGTISGNFNGDEFKVNSQKPILINGDDSIQVVGSEGGTQIHGVSNGASVVYAGGVKEVHTDTEGTFTFGEDSNTVAVTVQGDDNVNFKLNANEYIEDIADVQGDLIFSYTSDNLFINGIGGTFAGGFSSVGAYDNLLYIHDVADGSTFTTNDADKIWLQMLGEKFTLNNNALTLTNDADGIWLRDKEIVGLDTNASLKVSAAGNYVVNETELKAKAGNVIIGVDDGAYIYDARYPYFTKNTTNDEFIKFFKPERTAIINSGKETLEGGALAIVEESPWAVDIAAGDRATIVSHGDNVNVNLTDGNTWLFPLNGSMSLEGYEAATGTGFGMNKENILAAVEDGYINFSRGRLTLDDAEVWFPESNELMNFFNRYGKQYKVGFASQGEQFDASNETDDLILVAKRNGTVTGGSGDDTILANAGSFVDAGAGNNLIKSDSANVVLNGRTTVEGAVDTVYIAGAAPGVDFKSGGLSLYYDDDLSKSLTFSGITSTKKLNLYYADSNALVSEVFIADDEWYNVSDGAADYYVGATAKKNHGLDFSGVSDAINVTMNTDYNSTTAEFWVNNIHSLRGGDGLTTIVGSDKSDTILAGTGQTTITAGKGNDKLYGSTSADKNSATFVYSAGDGQDSIENFDFMSDGADATADKVKFDDASGVTGVMLRGNDVMIKVNDADGFLMVEGARGQSFQLNDDLIAKVDTNVAFDGFTNCYVGVGAQATLTVGKGAGNVEVWLSDDSLEYHGTMYDGNFAVLDASQSDGRNILAGNELSNTIIGGTGDNSLWGGYGGANDLMIAGAGHNEYYYEVGNGHDTIQGANAGDVIHLGATLEQIDFDGTQMNASAIVVKFTDGGTLNINSAAEVSFSFDDGTNIKANRQTQQFE